ncbi:MAG TPA: protein kinase, partial [Chthoniobacterales bacterium]
MHPTPTESNLRCEQCGGPLTSRLGCMRCLLTVGVGSDAEVATGNSGNRYYQHYEVLTRDDGSLWELGRGEMGVTYKAVDVNLRIPVALKVINGHISSQPGAQGRFLREARAAAQLRHPNVASVFHFGVINALPSSAEEKEVESGDCFYAMEFIEGETLEKRLRRSGPLNPVTALTIGVQIARALAAAEKRGLVHRDLKPANVMLLDEDEVEVGERSNGKVHGPWVKVIDFGLAKAATAEDDASGSALPALGTPAFSSPEQRQGQSLDIRSDIYSLGATLWYALTGRVPVSEKKAHAARVVPTLSLAQQFTRNIPLPVIRLLESTMAADPNARPASAAALVEALQECLEEITERRSHPIPTITRRRNKAAIFASAAILVGLAVYLLQPFSSTDDKSIAVLPFQNLSTDPNNAFFAEGLQDDLVSSLVKIRDLKVVARTGMLPGDGRDMASIGRALGVRHVLRGSLRRTGDRVLLQVSLLDTRDGRTLWSDSYDRTLANAVSLQGELAASIADALDATLSQGEKVALHCKPTVNPDAYLLYLRARKYDSGAAVAISNYEAAEALYEQALAFDPSFALAHARLASRLALLYHFRGPSEDLKTRAHAEAREALQLQPNLGEGHLAKGLCAYYIDRDFARALPEFQIAQRLLPNDPETESFIAYVHRRQGKWREARKELEEVAIRDPRSMNYEEELYA